MRICLLSVLCVGRPAAFIQCALYARVCGDLLFTVAAGNDDDEFQSQTSDYHHVENIKKRRKTIV